MTRALATCLALLCVTACTSAPPPVPENVSVGLVSTDAPPSRLREARAPIQAANGAPPQIKSMHFSALDVCRRPYGFCRNDWSASFLTSTNVASVEVRTNLFSINVPRTDFGKFAFSVRVLDLPPIFIRDYRLRVIARNSAGVAYEEDLPFRIR